MTVITKDPIRQLPKAPQPPLSHPGATPDSDRAKRPALAEPSATDQELSPGDRVEGLANFGKPTGEFGTVEQARGWGHRSKKIGGIKRRAARKR